MSGRVLLIEDEPHIAEAIRFILSRDGWTVASHATGHAALDAVRRERPDALVLDVILPGRGGIELLGDLKDDPALAAIPVLVLSANSRERGRAEAAGADRFIAKPFANDEIVAALREVAGP